MKKPFLCTFIATLFCLMAYSKVMLSKGNPSTYLIKQIHTDGTGIGKLIANKNHALQFVFPFLPDDSLKKISKEKYLRKSRALKTIGFVFAGGGAILFATGLIIDIVKKEELLAGLGYEAAGLMSLLCSIPFFLIAWKNKRKSMAISLKNQQYLMPGSCLISLKSQPALSMKINF